MIWMIDNYDSFVHNLAAYLEELECDVILVRNDKIDLDWLAHAVEETETFPQLEGIIISPGPKSPEDCGLCKQALCIAAGRVPVLGVCLGHQIIAGAYGAKVVRGSKPMHGKVSVIRHNGEGLFEGLPERFAVTRYHSLVVSDSGFPATLRIDARSDDGEIMAISHRKLPIYGVQFHPEAVLTEHGHDILRAFSRICSNWQKGRRTQYACRQGTRRCQMAG